MLSSTLGAAGVAISDANLCFLNSLDPAKVAGTIVVCDRGTNARVEKSEEVKRAGGVGMILINPTPSDQVADFHTVPSIHLDSDARAPIRAYAANAGATATIGIAYQDPNVIAPVMADFSSRGPNKANGDILKPDVTAPGVDVIAGWGDNSFSQAQHDQLVLNNFRPSPNANRISGTSMSTPHVAGVAALLKQLHPSWSPAAIKSALMTTTTGVKLADGTPDLDRWGYGAGHINPNGAADPGLVYDAGTIDYVKFLCGLSLAPPAGYSCAASGSIRPYDLNLASLTAGSVPGTLTLVRSVTNVTGTTATFTSSTDLPGWNVTVTPPSLTLAPGARGDFSVALRRTTATNGVYTFGSLAWNDGVGHVVTSPLTARSLGFVPPAAVTDTRATGTKVVTFVSGYDGTLQVSPAGLYAARLDSSTVAQDATQCVDIPVAAGALLARFQLFNADTQGGSATDLDLEVFSGPGGTGTSVGTSGGGASNEVVTLTAPAAGIYSACVTGYSTPVGGAAFMLSSWAVDSSVAPNLRASGPRAVYAGGTASVGIGWSVSPGQRYLGNVQFKNGTEVLGAMTVFINAK